MALHKFLWISYLLAVTIINFQMTHTAALPLVASGSQAQKSTIFRCACGKQFKTLESARFCGRNGHRSENDVSSAASREVAFKGKQDSDVAQAAGSLLTLIPASSSARNAPASSSSSSSSAVVGAPRASNGEQAHGELDTLLDAFLAYDTRKKLEKTHGVSEGLKSEGDRTICPIAGCSHKASTPWNLTAHTIRMHNFCRSCGTQYDTRELAQQCRSKHKRERKKRFSPYETEPMHNGSADVSNRNEAQAGSSGSSGSSSSSSSSSSFSSSSSLSSPASTTVRAPKKYACKWAGCNEIFDHPAHFAGHMAAHKRTVFSKRCPIAGCNESFSRSDIDDHLLTHMEKCPHGCKVSYYKHELPEHIRLWHRTAAAPAAAASGSSSASFASSSSSSSSSSSASGASA